MADRRNKSFSIWRLAFSILEFLGRPVLYLILNTLYLILFFLALVGKITLQSIKLVSQIKLPQIKITLPRLPLPRISPVKLILLCFSALILFMLYFFILRDLPKPKELDT